MEKIEIENIFLRFKLGQKTLDESTKEILLLFSVSRQSELLCDFLEWYDVDLTLEEREMEIKTYMDMKSHNCY